MALAGELPPDASTASTGLGLRYIGEHIYGYSGIVSVNDSETTMLETTSGSGYIVAKVTFNGLGAAEDFDHFVYLNDQVVQLYRSEDRPARASNNIPLIIPPFSKLKLSAQNVTNTGGRDQVVSIVGRVYDA